MRYQVIKKNSTKRNLRMVSVEQGVPVGGGDVTWREEDCTATNRCWRRDQEIVCMEIRLVPCTSPRTSSVLDEIRSLPRGCIAQGKP